MPHGKHLNKSGYRRLEKLWESAVENKQTVKVSIGLDYSQTKDDLRPVKFKIKIEVNMVTKEIELNNAAGSAVSDADIAALKTAIGV